MTRRATSPRSGIATSTIRARSSTCRRTPTASTRPTTCGTSTTRLLGSIEDVVGRSVTEQELRASLALFNRNRALMRELYDVKRETPWLIGADEAYVLTAIGGLIPREEHNELLEAALPMIRERPGRQREDRVRVVFEGGFCEQPPIDLLRMISESCYVVDDDLLIGLRWITEDVSMEGDPAGAAGGGLSRTFVLQPRPARPAQAQGEDAAGAHSRGDAPRPPSWPPRRCANRALRSRSRTPRPSTRSRHPVLRDGVSGKHDEPRSTRDPA